MSGIQGLLDVAQCVTYVVVLGMDQAVAVEEPEVCASGNFLVVADKQMPSIEAEVNKRRGERHLRAKIPLTNFRGIELRDFPAEIAWLALIIAEYQWTCGIAARRRLADFAPLDAMNWITSNA